MGFISVQGMRIDPPEEPYRELPSGSFWWTIDRAAIWAILPFAYDNGAPALIRLPVSREPSPKRWQWDGNLDKPTLTPSIRCRGGDSKPDLWHGYLTDGVFRACE